MLGVSVLFLGSLAWLVSIPFGGSLLNCVSI
jgi:hypothetical protein